MTKNGYRQFISKPEISFWVPIITSVVVVAASWFNLSLNVALLTQKVDNLVTQNEALIKKYSDVEGRYGTLSLQVQRLETHNGLGPIK